MHLNYERSLLEDSTAAFSYEECLHIVRGLETVKKRHLKNSPVVEKVAALMQKNGVRNMALLSQLIEDMADGILGESKPSSARVEQPEPAR
jgi:hypothetical protein